MSLPDYLLEPEDDVQDCTMDVYTCHCEECQTYWQERHIEEKIERYQAMDH